MEIAVNVDEDVIWAEKDKDAEPTYKFDLSELMPRGDTIAAADWVVAAGTVTVISSSTEGAVAFVKVGGGTQQAWSSLRCRWTSSSGDRGDFVMRIYTIQDLETVSELGSALFPNRFTAVAKLRRDRLVQAGKLAGKDLTDAYLWDKLRAAESEISHELRVPLAPTRFFSTTPTPEQIAALDGKPWQIDPPYDYEANFYMNERWGFIVSRNKPIVELHSVKFIYPSPGQGVFDVPLDWVRMDKKYGHIRFVPTNSAQAMQFGIGMVMMTSFGGSNTVPFVIHVDYTAGLENVARDYPDLIDVVQRMAVLSAIEDTFRPQSGSISADGLSQSMSVDMEKYRDIIDRKLNGPKGGNGGLMTAIHGVRSTVMGV